MTAADRKGWFEKSNEERMSKLTARSIWFVSCVSIGLLLGYLDGFSTKALVQTALLAAGLFVVFLLAEALWRKHRKQ